jgi:hypothetical protein
VQEQLAANAQFKSECERLKQVIKQLEEERDRDRKALAALQAERDAYRRSLYAWARQQVREEDWQNFSEGDYSLPADQVLAELEKLQHQ